MSLFWRGDSKGPRRMAQVDHECPADFSDCWVASTSRLLACLVCQCNEMAAELITKGSFTPQGIRKSERLVDWMNRTCLT